MLLPLPPHLVLLAAFAAAKPVIRSSSNVHFTNSSIFGINQTSIDAGSTSTSEEQPACTATYVARRDRNCGIVAVTHNLQLSSSEASLASGSTECGEILGRFGICVGRWIDPSSILPTASGVSSNGAILNTTSSDGRKASVLSIDSAEPMITTLETKTLLYTWGLDHKTSRRITLTGIKASSTASALARLSTTSLPTLNPRKTATPNVRNVASPCTESVPPPATTQTGIISGCTDWYVAKPGDYCYLVAERYGISVDNFMDWNPSVGTPNCQNMLAGDAYCVATCGASVEPQAPTTSAISVGLLSSVTLTLTASATSVAPSSVSSSTADGGTYHAYLGVGTVAAGWPDQSQWLDFDTMFSENTPKMRVSCATWNVPDNSDSEIAEMKSAIQTIASQSGIDERFILAVVMQESTGCVRVITTNYGVSNPGLMQSHNGPGTCNSLTGLVQTPCPASEILQMITDGVRGTSTGDGLEQLYEAQVAAGFESPETWYRTARAYNGGEVASTGNLEDGCCTSSYASDIANRLTGWIDEPRVFDA